MTSSLFVNVRAALNGLEYYPAGLIVAVDGTLYPGSPFPPQPLLDDGNGWFSGFSSGMVGGLANTQDGLWASACIGYPAAVLPMWPSVQIGRAYVNAALELYAQNYLQQNGSLNGLAILLTGYSQGAMVTDQVWVLDILDPSGALNYLLPYVWRVYNFGDPFRCPGIANGNTILAGLPVPGDADGYMTGGIGGALDLTAQQTNYPAPDGKPVVMSCANPGDIYSAAPVGPNPWSSIAAPGKVGNMIFQEVQNPSFMNTIKIATSLLVPVGMVEEIINGLVFAAEGLNSPHYQYIPQMDACISDALAIGNALPHAG